MNPQLINQKQPWLTLVIPTCNRPLHIAEPLSKYSSMSRFSDCVLSIYDSSTDDQTKDAVSPYLRYANIHYYRYPHSPEPNAPIFKGCYRYPFDSWIAASLKTQAGLESATTDYVFLDGDAYLLNLDKIDRAWLDGHPESDFFVLNERFSLDHSAVKENQILTFDDFEDFFVKWYWRATLYGATIVRKLLLSKFDFDHCW